MALDPQALQQIKEAFGVTPPEQVLRIVSPYRLAKRRATEGWTQVQLAAAADISPSYLAKIEAGARWHVSASVVARIAALLGMEPEEFAEAMDDDQ